MSSQPSRRQMLGTLGTLAAAGGWIGLNADETFAQPASGDAGRPAAYTLPPLGYDYADLEPHIDAQTMMLHHDKHHDGYVRGLNAAIDALAKVRSSGSADDLAKISSLTDALAFNGSGHMLHTIFWKNMKKEGGGAPKGELASIIDRDFGNFESFQSQFSTAAGKVAGSGWGILAWEPLSGRLITMAPEKHQNGTMWGCVPLLVLDVWEHAYYLKYQNRRADYVKAFFNVVDWSNVSERLSLARRLTM